MSIDVDINLRIPNVKEPAKDSSGYPIVNADVRFVRTIAVPTIPKPGQRFDLEAADGTVLTCDVLRAEWNERLNRFVVYCAYAKRSMPSSEYWSLFNDPRWVRRPLL